MAWEVVIKKKTSKHRCGVELGRFKTLNMVSLLDKEQKVTKNKATTPVTGYDYYGLHLNKCRDETVSKSINIDQNIQALYASF